ncbi:hypothetical protein TDB9533_01224 [Thalassocella blandensis]|nr:hypothetical protein TDB9533_01224 [Thalassocella blandensis]
MMIFGEKGGKAGGGAARAAQEDPNTLKSIAVANVIDLVSEGEIVGLVDGMRSVYLDGVPLQNDDDSYNFDGVSIATRVGTPEQDYIPGFTSVEAEHAVDQEITQGVPVARSITDEDIDAVRVKIVVPTLTKQNPENGDLHGYHVSITIERQSNGGGWEECVTDVIRGKTTSDYERAYRIPKPEGGAPWQIRVVRNDPDSDDDATISNKTYWGTYTEIIDVKMTYPDSALVAVNINAEQFGDKIPKREYDILGRVIQVPSNYDPETREYSGIWNGTFKNAWSDNPAWCYYDMVTNDRYGLGEFISSAAVDKGRLYQIAQYCDELVPDGFGGMEPRFTLNVQIRTREEAFTLIRKMSSAFRGVTYWGSGAVIPVQDAPADPDFIASPANVIDGKFTYGSTSLKDSCSVALVSYNDPNDGEKATIEPYQDADAIKKYGWRQKDVVAFGCDSRGLARRTGKWEVETSQNEKRTVKFSVGLDHFNARPFSIIAVQDPLIAGIRLSGRVVSATENRLVVDKLPDDLNTDYDYTLKYIAADGSVITVDVESFNLELSTIIPSTNFSPIPKSFAMWMLEAVGDLDLQLFRVRNANYQNDNTFSIEGEQHDPNKYARIEQDLYFDDPDFTDLPEGPILPPTNLLLSEYLYNDGVAIKSAVNASCTPSADPRATLIQFQYKLTDDEAWQPGQVDSEPLFTLRDVREGLSVAMRVRTVSQTGRRSVWVESDPYEVLGKTAPPATPTGFAATIRRDSGVLLKKNPAIDVDYKETAFFVGETFSTATEVARLAGDSYLLDTLAAGTYTFWCVDFDTGNRPSNEVSAGLTIIPPSVDDMQVSFIGENFRLSFTGIEGSFPIAYYEIRHEGALIAEVDANEFTAKVEFLGSRIFTVHAVDTVNVSSVGVDAPVNVVVPGVVSITANVIDNYVEFTYNAALGSLPVDRYEFFIGGEGDTFATATKFQDKAGSSSFTLKQVNQGGLYHFWIVARDTANNAGPESIVTRRLGDPPDFTLFNSFRESEAGFDGVKTNCLIDSDVLIGLVDPTETWAEYASNGYDTMQDEVDAGMDAFLLPGVTSAEYQKVYDLGAILGQSLITVNVSQQVFGGVSTTVSIEYSTDGVSYTLAEATQTHATNFQYVRITVEWAADGGLNDYVLVSDIETNLTLKEQTDGGRATGYAADASGTSISFNKSFVDIVAINITPIGNENATYRLVFTDVPNPTEFEILWFDEVGARINLDFYWSARGYIAAA